jgi:hypothetical protein
MPQYPDGTRIHQAEWNRLLEAIPASYTVWKDGTQAIAESNLNGGTDYTTGTDAAVFQNAVDALPVGGGKIVYRDKLIFTSPVTINKTGVHLSGENTAADLYFVRDGAYHGVSNKARGVIIADDIDAFQVGKDAFIQSFCLENTVIHGKNDDSALGEGIHSDGAGVRVFRGNMLHFKNVQVIGKEYGLHFATEGGFAYDNVIDMVECDNIFLSFNQIGIYIAGGWFADSTFRNIYGYLNQKNLLKFTTLTYNIILDNIMSALDNNGDVGVDDVPIYLAMGDINTLLAKDVSIQGTDSVNPLMRILIGKTWLKGARITFDNLVLYTCLTDSTVAIGGDGDATIIFNGLHGGIGGPAADPTLAGPIIHSGNVGDCRIYVDGGWLDCTVVDKKRWFYAAVAGQLEVHNVRGFNQVGIVTNPFSEVLDAVGLYGDNAVPVANKTYTVNGFDCFITSSGGTGVSITIKNADGGTIASGLGTLTAMFLSTGSKISFGNFTVDPTVVVSGV